MKIEQVGSQQNDALRVSDSNPFDMDIREFRTTRPGDAPTEEGTILTTAAVVSVTKYITIAVKC